MRYTIGVIGSATGNMVNQLTPIARGIGREIAQYKDILLTGAGLGLPYEAVLGANELNGLTIGFSPASNLKEHLENYKFPTEGFAMIVYTGFGLKGRNVVMIRSCDAVVLISGRIGTMNEFTIAYDEKKPIGVLENSGGVSGRIKGILEDADKKGGEVVFDSDPKILLKELMEKLQ